MLILIDSWYLGTWELIHRDVWHWSLSFTCKGDFTENFDGLNKNWLQSNTCIAFESILQCLKDLSGFSTNSILIGFWVTSPKTLLMWMSGRYVYVYVCRHKCSSMLGIFWCVIGCVRCWIRQRCCGYQNKSSVSVQHLPLFLSTAMYVSTMCQCSIASGQKKQICSSHHSRSHSRDLISGKPRQPQWSTGCLMNARSRSCSREFILSKPCHLWWFIV